MYAIYYIGMVVALIPFMVKASPFFFQIPIKVASCV